MKSIVQEINCTGNQLYRKSIVQEINCTGNKLARKSVTWEQKNRTLSRPVKFQCSAYADYPLDRQIYMNIRYIERKTETHAKKDRQTCREKKKSFLSREYRRQIDRQIDGQMEGKIDIYINRIYKCYFSSYDAFSRQGNREIFGLIFSYYES